ncbi:MAG: hypothetical protein ACK5RE_19485, partial [Pseudanabaena sp.]
SFWVYALTKPKLDITKKKTNQLKPKTPQPRGGAGRRHSILGYYVLSKTCFSIAINVDIHN